MPNVTFVNSTSNTVSSTGTIPLTVPSGVQEGDLLIAFAAQANNKNWDAPPSGWLTTIDDGVVPLAPSPPRYSIWYKWATDSEPSSYSFTNDGTGDDVAGGMLAYRNVSLVDYNDATEVVASASTGNADPGSITTVTDGAMVVAIAFVDRLPGFSAGPSGYNLRVNAEIMNVNGVGVAAADKVVSTAGAEDPGAYTNASQEWECVTLAIKPGHNISVGLDSETDSALQAAPDRAYDVGIPSETDSLFVLATRIIVGLPFDVNFGVRPALILPIASDTSSPLGLYEQTITIGLNSDISSALPLAQRVKVGLPIERVFSLDLFLGAEVGLPFDESTAFPLYRFLPNIDVSSGVRQAIEDRYIDVSYEDGHSQRSTFLDPSRHVWRLSWDNVTDVEEEILRSFFNEKAAVKPIAWIPFNHTTQRRFIARGFESQPSGFGVHSASVMLEEVFE